MFSVDAHGHKEFDEDDPMHADAPESEGGPEGAEPSPAPAEPMEEDEVDETFQVRGMAMSAVFRPTAEPNLDPPTIEHMDFHDDGRFLITADSANEILLVDALQGKVTKRTLCATNPVGLVKYTHHEQSVLCSSRGCRFADDHTPGQSQGWRWRWR